MARPIRSIVFSILLLGSLIAMSGVAIAAGEEELEDGGFYWQGTTIVKDGYAPNANEAALYTEAGKHVRNISLDGGDLAIDTSDLRGKYYVTAQGTSRLNFEIIVQEVGVGIHNLRLEEDPLRIVVDVSVSTNRGRAEIVVTTKSVDDFASRVSGDVETVDDSTIRIADTGGRFTYDLRGLGTGEYTVFADDAEREASGFDQVTINGTVAPPAGGDRVAAERGGGYWRPSVLVFENVAADRIYHIETLAGERVRSQLSTTSGTLYVGTSGLDPGVYRILSASNGSEVTRFSLKVHELSATVEGDTVTIDSNRAGYNASLRIANGSANVTADVLQNASGGTVLRTGLSESEEIALFTDALAPGEYRVYLQATESSAAAVANFTVEEPTPTPTGTPSPTPTATAVSTTTDQPTATETASTSMPSTATSEGPMTETSAPGFGPVLAVLALAMMAVGLLLRSRD